MHVNLHLFRIFCSIIGLLLVLGTLYEICIYQEPSIEDEIISDLGHSPEVSVNTTVNDHDTSHLMSDGSRGAVLSVRQKFRSLGEICQYVK